MKANFRKSYSAITKYQKLLFPIQGITKPATYWFCLHPACPPGRRRLPSWEKKADSYLLVFFTFTSATLHPACFIKPAILIIFFAFKIV